VRLSRSRSRCVSASQVCSIRSLNAEQVLILDSYISELVDHVRRLEARSNPSPTASADTPQGGSLNAAAKAESILPGTSLQHEHHFAYAADSYRYLGSESCLLKSPRLQSTYVRSPFDEEDDFVLEWKSSPQKLHELVEEYLECMYELLSLLFTCFSCMLIRVHNLQATRVSNHRSLTTVPGHGCPYGSCAYRNLLPQYDLFHSMSHNPQLRKEARRS
jgi:hypothetical protein